MSTGPKLSLLHLNICAPRLRIVNGNTNIYTMYAQCDVDMNLQSRVCFLYLKSTRMSKWVYGFWLIIICQPQPPAKVNMQFVIGEWAGGMVYNANWLVCRKYCFVMWTIFATKYIFHIIPSISTLTKIFILFIHVHTTTNLLLVWNYLALKTIPISKLQ